MVYIILTFLLFTFYAPINSQTPLAVPEEIYADQDAARSAYGLTPFLRDSNLVDLAQAITNQCNWDLSITSSWKTQQIMAYANKSGEVYKKGKYSQTLGLNRGAATEGFTSVSWLEQKEHWHCETNTCDSGRTCGGFTQSIWKNSVKIGCALTSCETGSPWGDEFPVWENLFCFYNPAGNFAFNGIQEHPFGNETWRCSLSTVSSAETEESNQIIQPEHDSFGLHSLGVGTIIGIVVGSFVGFIILIGVIVFVAYKCRAPPISHDNGIYRSMN